MNKCLLCIILLSVSLGCYSQIEKRYVPNPEENVDLLTANVHYVGYFPTFTYTKQEGMSTMKNFIYIIDPTSSFSGTHFGASIKFEDENLNIIPCNVSKYEESNSTSKSSIQYLTKYFFNKDDYYELITYSYSDNKLRIVNEKKETLFEIDLDGGFPISIALFSSDDSDPKFMIIHSRKNRLDSVTYYKFKELSTNINQPNSNTSEYKFLYNSSINSIEILGVLPQNKESLMTITSMKGEVLMISKLNPSLKNNLVEFNKKGVYILSIYNDNKIIATDKIIIYANQ